MIRNFTENLTKKWLLADIIADSPAENVPQISSHVDDPEPINYGTLQVEVDL